MANMAFSEGAILNFETSEGAYLKTFHGIFMAQSSFFLPEISWHTYLTGSTASGVYMEARMQPDPKAGIWMVPVDMPPPLSAL